MSGSMNTPRTVFFGSTSDSVLVLEKLAASRLLSPVAVITQPPKPVGRKQLLTPTPVEAWAKNRNVTILSFPGNPEKPWLYAEEQTVIDTLEPLKADILISASYGQKIPAAAIERAPLGGINVHPSLLPRWRGADPVPWAIYSGDHQTGVTIVRLSARFDAGLILAQEKLNITGRDTTGELRPKLFSMGADLLVKTLPDIVSGHIKGVLQKNEGAPYAKRLTRDDGFEPWDEIVKAFTDLKEAARIDRKYRAFIPWPGLWTNIAINNKEKRLKILSITYKEELITLDTVQMEGKKPAPFKQFQKAYLFS